MDIKVGDIVTIWERRQRVTQIHRYHITLSHTGIVNLNDFKRYVNTFKNGISI